MNAHTCCWRRIGIGQVSISMHVHTCATVHIRAEPLELAVEGAENQGDGDAANELGACAHLRGRALHIRAALQAVEFGW